MFANEEWRIVEEFPQYYISNYGRVKHVDRVDARKPAVNNRGYLTIALYHQDNSTRFLRQINKLVADAFLPPPVHENGELIKTPTVWHIDGDFSNCRAENLKWDRRDRVYEWNEMHRSGQPKFRTPKVRNNTTGRIYDNAFACAMAEGVLESDIVWRVERQARHIYDDNARYRYVTD